MKKQKDRERLSRTSMKLREGFVRCITLDVKAKTLNRIFLQGTLNAGI